MPSYIEAGELLMELNDTDIFDTYNDYSMVFDTIDNFPAADVAPVRHGHWISQFVSKRGLSDHFVCSECAESSFTSHKVKMIKYDYCPRCGTKMNGNPYE